MGLGILSTIKGFLPPVIYGLGIVAALRAVVGRTAWARYLVLFLMPLRNVTEKLYAFPMGKDLTDILLIGLLVGWAVGRRASEDAPRWTPSPINGPAVALMLYTYVSLWVGYFTMGYFTPFDLSDARLQDAKNYMILPLLFLIVLNTVRTRREVWRTFAVMMAGMLVSGFYVFQQVTWFQGIVSRLRIHGTFVFLGPNEVAAFFNQYGILLLGLSFFVPRASYRIALRLLSLVAFYCVLFLFSRGAYIALTIGLFFLFMLKKRLLLVPLCLALISWHTILPESVRHRIEMTETEDGRLDASSEARIQAWKEAMGLFVRHPVFGVGFHVFRHLGFELGDTHNIYVKILAEQGAVGFLVFLLLLSQFWRAGWRLYRTGDDEWSRGLGFAFLLCVLVMMINNVFGNRWVYLTLSSYLWATAALVERLRILSDEGRPRSDPVSTARRRHAPLVHPSSPLLHPGGRR